MTTHEIYDRYTGRLWRAWSSLQDWTPNGSFRTPPTVPVDWPRWRRIHARYEREYDRAEHATHGPTFRPLWCAHCTPAAQP